MSMKRYIQALQKYSIGDKKEIIEKIEIYQTEVQESKKSLYELKYDKESLYKKIDKGTKKIEAFKTKIRKN